MMIVVPALAHREDGEPKAVPAFLTCLVATGAEHVAERIDGERGVIKNHRADKEARHQPHHGVAEPEMADEKAESTRNKRWDENAFIQPDQFWKLLQIPHDVRIVIFILLGKNPANVRPIKTLQFGGMNILIRV